MGLLAKALTEQSSYAAKKTDLWLEILARIEMAVLPEDIDEAERYVMQIGLQVPGAWEEPIEELIEKKRIEIAKDNLSLIMHEKYDFT